MEKNIETKKINLALLVCLVGFPQISETIYTPSLTEIAKGYGVSLNLLNDFKHLLSCFCCWCLLLGR